jgi:hypothetical protein
MAFERSLYDPALHAASSSVHDTDFVKARSRRSLDVLGDNRGNVARREGVKIELGLDGDAFHLRSTISDLRLLAEILSRVVWKMSVVFERS